MSTRDVSPSATPPALAEPEAAKYIGFTPAALRSWRRENRGPAYVRAGRNVRYLVADLDRWLAPHRIDPGERS